MNVDECAKVLAKVQLVDNREVTSFVVLDWMDYIGDLDYHSAITAVVKFRREQPGVYLEPGHIRSLAGVVVADVSIPDIQAELEAGWKREALAAAGVTEAEYAEHEHDTAWIREHFSRAQFEVEPIGFEAAE